ncbi:MAG TPA: T9SS type A sorting domain-containing protein [Bacteroidota bacterium]|jgi:hypothetical protein|nr:T9SS type A sorting domain-containing protein [Bacteroidota bacterium]
MKNLFLCIVLLCLAAAPLYGQINITSTDVAATMAPGKTTTTHTDTSTHTLNIGSAGATSWNFSGLALGISSGSVAVQADTTQFFSNYPTATHAWMAGDIYSYYKLSPTALEFLGVQQASGFQQKSINNPPAVLMQLPLTSGTSWTSTYDDTTHFTIGGSNITSVAHVVADFTADAFGSLTFPSSTVYQAVRVKVDRHTTTNGHTGRLITYEFMTKEGATVTVVPSDTTQPSTGSISVSATSWYEPTAVSVTELPGVIPQAFSLGQNYPNPFNPVTAINFSVPVSEYVSLSIYGLLGNQVATLVSGQLAPGSYSAQWDGSGAASGVYIYRMTAGTFTETKRLVLLK